ncbi:uncharacterized protein LY89DRAFT_760869 [Mollisia scopiformis]|uniref:Uncharacterized protein n=1 Tax=Mollisia scopiformis TaxID=149040 RepID=A0A132BDH5_MOLSC|nr:uncharacterized protein LY89DRAFT_760869 [Mollisia scopiformis]KUJ10039.1 hypothetical protein LY89DRAFT_760869 [Mollisia scopiformis]
MEESLLEESALLAQADEVIDPALQVETLKQEIANLKAELARASQKNRPESAQAPEQSSLKHAPTTQEASKISSCDFLRKLLVEIRVELYRNLLISPIFGEPESVHSHRELGLTPGILGTCRQFYHEGMPILYGENTFYISCSWDTSDIEQRCCCRPHYWTPKDNPWDIHRQGCLFVRDNFNRSPITRSLNAAKYRNNHVQMGNISAVKYIKHWKVIINTLLESENEDTDRWCAIDFCQAVCKATPKSLEIVIVHEDSDSATRWNGVYQTLEATLEPFKLLRNLKKLNFRTADLSDIVVGRGIYRMLEAPNVDLSQLLSTEQQDALRQLMTSNAEIERPQDMLTPLLAYAQAFERYQMFKLQMGLSLDEESRVAQKLGPDFDDIIASEFAITNPFCGRNPHTVEAELLSAMNAVSRNSMDDFKRYRSVILAYLEDQYQAVCSARIKLSGYIQGEMTQRGLFSTTDDIGEQNPYIRSLETDFRAKWLLMLEDYADSFRRHMPFQTRVNWNRNKRRLENLYNAMPRELAINQMHQMFEVDKFQGFLSVFKAAFEDVEKQFFDICNARERLFICDITEDYGLDWEMSMPTENDKERVIWNVNVKRSGPTLEAYRTHHAIR